MTTRLKSAGYLNIAAGALTPAALLGMGLSSDAASVTQSATLAALGTDVDVLDIVLAAFQLVGDLVRFALAIVGAVS